MQFKKLLLFYYTIIIHKMQWGPDKKANFPRPYGE